MPVLGNPATAKSNPDGPLSMATGLTFHSVAMQKMNAIPLNHWLPTLPRVEQYLVATLQLLGFDRSRGCMVFFCCYYW